MATNVSSGQIYTISNGTSVADLVVSPGGVVVNNGTITGSSTVNSGGTVSGGTLSNSAYDYGVVSGITVAVAPDGAGYNLYVQSGGKTYNTVAAGANAYEIVLSGGSASGTIISSNGNQNISNGGIAYNTTVSSGGYLRVYSGGSASGVTALTAANVSNYGTIINATIANSVNVSNSGTLSNVIVSNGAYISNYNGIIAGSSIIRSGGIISGGTLSNSAYNYGVVSGITVAPTANGGAGYNLYVQSGGKTYNTVAAGPNAYEVVSNGGIASGTIVSSGANQNISSGGVAYGTTVSGQGYLRVASGGSATNATVFSGAYISNSGNLSNVTISSGANISNWGVISGATLLSGARLGNLDSGVDYYTVISSGAFQRVGGQTGASEFGTDHSGSSYSATIFGSQYISWWGYSEGATVESGGSLFVNDGIVSNVTVNSGGLITLSYTKDVPRADGPITLNLGGSAVVFTSAVSGAVIDLVGDTNSGLTISGLENGGTLSMTISNFNGQEGNSDEITLAGVKTSNITSVAYVDAAGNASNDYVTLYTNSGSIILNIVGIATTGYRLDANSSGDAIFEVCFLTGTLIRTLNGVIAVEDLVIGDKVITYDWENNKEEIKTIRWVGSKAAKANPLLPNDEAGYPVRVLKDAISPNIPNKDLLITPEHCLFFDGKFIPVRMLVNGSSIYYDSTITDYTYYHIETDEHSVIYADGMLTESYLDTGNRAQFRQHQDIAILSRPGKPKDWRYDACSPLTTGRIDVEIIYNQIRQRAKKIGLATIHHHLFLTDNPNLHLLTNEGAIIYPKFNHDNKYTFMLPRNVESVYLASRVNKPSDIIGPFVDDRRYLGVLVGSISIITCNDLFHIHDHLEQGNLEGWDVIEQSPCRWTNGKALLNIKQNQFTPKVLVVEILSSSLYRIDQNQEEILQKIKA